jgi:hypothetical protein
MSYYYHTHTEETHLTDFTTHLYPLYKYVETMNKGLALTPDVVDILKDLDNVWDKLNALETPIEDD